MVDEIVIPDQKKEDYSKFYSDLLTKSLKIDESDSITFSIIKDTIVASITERWSVIRKESYSQLKNLLKNVDDMILNDLLGCVLSFFDFYNSQATFWHEVQGYFFLLHSILINSKSIEKDASIIFDICITFTSHPQLDVRDVSNICMLDLFQKEHNLLYLTNWYNTVLSQIRECATFDDYNQSDSFGFHLDGLLSFLLKFYQRRDEMKFFDQISRVSITEIFDIVALLMNHRSSLIRQKVASILCIIYNDPIKLLDVSNLKEARINIIDELTKSINLENSSSWRRQETALLAIVDIFKETFYDIVLSLAGLPGIENQQPVISELMIFIIKIFPKFISHKQFEIRRMAIQLFPWLIRLIITSNSENIIDVMINHFISICPSIIPSNPNITTENNSQPTQIDNSNNQEPDRVDDQSNLYGSAGHVDLVEVLTMVVFCTSILEHGIILYEVRDLSQELTSTRETEGQLKGSEGTGVLEFIRSVRESEVILTAEDDRINFKRVCSLLCHHRYPTKTTSSRCDDSVEEKPFNDGGLGDITDGNQVGSMGMDRIVSKVQNHIRDIENVICSCHRYLSTQVRIISTDVILGLFYLQTYLSIITPEDTAVDHFIQFGIPDMLVTQFQCHRLSKELQDHLNQTWNIPEDYCHNVSMLSSFLKISLNCYDILSMLTTRLEAQSQHHNQDSTWKGGNNNEGEDPARQRSFEGENATILTAEDAVAGNIYLSEQMVQHMETFLSDNKAQIQYSSDANLHLFLILMNWLHSSLTDRKWRSGSHPNTVKILLKSMAIISERLWSQQCKLASEVPILDNPTAVDIISLRSDDNLCVPVHEQIIETYAITLPMVTEDLQIQVHFLRSLKYYLWFLEEVHFLQQHTSSNLQIKKLSSIFHVKFQSNNGDDVGDNLNCNSGDAEDRDDTSEFSDWDEDSDVIDDRINDEKDISKNCLESELDGIRTILSKLFASVGEEL